MDEDAEERGQRSDEEHDFPHVTGVDFAFGAEFAEVHADEACGDVANGREGLKGSERTGSGAFGEAVRDERDGETEYAADAESGDEAVDGKVHPAFGERGETGADGVKEDGEGEGAGASDAVTDGAEDEATGGPAGDEDGGCVAAELFGVEFGGKKGLHGALACEEEELLVEAVEQPGEGSHSEDEPMVTGEVAPPWGLGG